MPLGICAILPYGKSPKSSYCLSWPVLLVLDAGKPHALLTESHLMNSEIAKQLLKVVRHGELFSSEVVEIVRFVPLVNGDLA